ncbi:hypothetical protein Fot_52934 [Forsythia ovata]|uniref:Uncharacterized protein n=1 Tax=Forsythia ovata TaxID=205694 RepID=A0ABD1PH89_9LAMI
MVIVVVLHWSGRGHPQDRLCPYFGPPRQWKKAQSCQTYHLLYIQSTSEATTVQKPKHLEASALQSLFRRKPSLSPSLHSLFLSNPLHHGGMLPHLSIPPQDTVYLTLNFIVSP